MIPKMLIVMKAALAAFALVLMSGPNSDCHQGCTTTFVVQDCDGSAVESAQVSIQACCGDNQKSAKKTNSSGEATFPVCAKDICKRRIVLSGFATSESAGNCTESDGDSRCTVKICPR